MAFDEADYRLFVHASDSEKLVIIDSFRSAQFGAKVQALWQATRQVWERQLAVNE
jgi:hypothetical protein